jgi:hypothetical protein
MISKTSMLKRVRGWDWKGVAAGLDEKPELIDFRDEKGRNWLHLCCMVKPEHRKRPVRDSVRTAEVLIDAGLDVNQEAFRQKEWKATTIWHAVGKGCNLALGKCLLERGADPNYTLWAASMRDDPAALKLLLDAGAEVDQTLHYDTPFFDAAKAGHWRSAQLLLERDADVNYQDRKGRTAMHVMLEKGYDAKDFQLLKKYGARVDLPNKSGKTVAEIMSRKRDPAFRKLAEELATG